MKEIKQIVIGTIVAFSLLMSGLTILARMDFAVDEPNRSLWRGQEVDCSGFIYQSGFWIRRLPDSVLFDDDRYFTREAIEISQRQADVAYFTGKEPLRDPFQPLFYPRERI